MTEQKPERRKDPLRHWKGRILEVLKPATSGMTLIALMLKLGQRSREDGMKLDKSLRELTFAGIISCEVSGARMVYRYVRDNQAARS